MDLTDDYTSENKTPQKDLSEKEIQVKVKNIFKPYILKVMSRAESENFHLVIGGGECFEYYFGKNTETSFLTTDFDIKICPNKKILDGMKNNWDLLIKDSENKNSKLKEMLDAMLKIRDITINQLGEFLKANSVEINKKLSKYDIEINSIEIDKEFESKGSHRKTLSYTHSYKGIPSKYINNVIDLVPEHPFTVPSFRPMIEVDGSNEKKLKEMINSTKVLIQSSTFPNYSYACPYYTPIFPDFEQDKITGVYYFKMSFIMFDTIRMVAEFTSRVNNGVAGNKDLQKTKRYLTKYIRMLMAFSNPDLYMKCNSQFVRDLVGYCSDKTNIIEVGEL